jgi:hypothetical protein
VHVSESSPLEQVDNLPSDPGVRDGGVGHLGDAAPKPRIRDADDIG